MSVLTVGAGYQFATISAAVATSHDGDVVQVQAGTYTNDFVTVNAKITIQSVGGMAKVVATVEPDNGKAIFTTNADATIRGFDISGAKVADENGAGIRYQSGNLVVDGCYIHDNQMGILGNSDPNGSITVLKSEVAFNGNEDGHSHNIYANDVKQVTIDGSYFHDARGGNEIKSRAEATAVTNSRIFDNGSDANWSIDIPQGGDAVIRGNVIEQGSNSPNRNFMNYGAEANKGMRAGAALVVDGNTFINHGQGANGLYNPTNNPATITNNTVYGMTVDQLVGSNTGTISGNAVAAAEPITGLSAPYASGPPVPAPAPAPAPDSGPAAYATYGRDGAVTPSGHVLTVGAGKQFATLHDAVAASRDGDVIDVDAGTYTNDFAHVRTKVVIEGVGGMARLVATGTSLDDKAILITDTDVTIRNVELTGAASSNGNGAGIRDQGGNLTLVNSYVHGNQMGLQVNDSKGGSVNIFDSEFGDNADYWQNNHNVNVDRIGSLTVDGSYFHGGKGHQIRTMSENTVIRDSRLIDGDDATASFGIEIARGGDVSIENNVIAKGANSANSIQLHIGTAGGEHSNSRYVIRGNTFVSNFADRWNPYTYNIVNDSAVPAEVSGNTFNARLGRQIVGLAGASGNTTVQAAPTLDTSAPWHADTRNAAAAPITAAAVQAQRSEALSFLADARPDDAGAPVIRLYQTALGRAPDASGALYWEDRLRTETPLHDIAQGFLDSPEFQARYNAPDDAGYVAQLYRNVLGRDGDAGGTAYWNARLAQGTDRASILVGFSESAENRAATDALFGAR